ncbi:hypothetical protein E2C01_048213 [Portunus trituberculatus]|uniref:Uncharacterized protein n=1 Tax=Portunus trituberculatus TaxID=210409 RepID=A0A5B7GAK0_PORTR|nr:hypothetical protein [Portunus trituberculatus]
MQSALDLKYGTISKASLRNSKLRASCRRVRQLQYRVPFYYNKLLSRTLSQFYFCFLLGTSETQKWANEAWQRHDDSAAAEHSECLLSTDFRIAILH